MSDTATWLLILAASCVLSARAGYWWRGGRSERLARRRARENRLVEQAKSQLRAEQSRNL